MKENSSLLNKTNRTVMVLVGIGLVLLSGCHLGNGFPLAAPATETQVIPTIFVPTPDCGASTLLLGSSTFQIEALRPGEDGTFAVPPDKSGLAYWVDSTIGNYTFVLSPTPENLAIMPTLTTGSPAKVTWSNCNSTTYSLSAPQQGSFNGSALPDQSVEGITIFFQTDVSGAGFVFRGELTEEQISTFNTPVPGGADVQAEISLLETTTLADGATIRVGVSILNYGPAPFSLTANEVSLTQEDGTALMMVSSEPALPKEVASGGTETIYFTFPRPASLTATLKILTIEYDIEGY